MKKGTINLEDVIILKEYKFYKMFPKHQKRKETKLLKKLDKYIITVEDFNKPLSIIDKSYE